MNRLFKPAIGITLLITAFAFSASNKPVQKTAVKVQPLIITKGPGIEDKHSKIQAAILLDVSNSMDGLIEQAKSQLWNMVSVMGKAECNGKTPQIEIALYEYGRPENDVKSGYIKQLNGFTSDLDGLSQKLFNLTTHGGDEYCGNVIFTSLNELKWDPSASNYKVIFIAGNEDFLQGNVSYTKACDAAKKKGVIVNTIYCGDKMQGIREHWSLNAECGNGSYTNINQDAKVEDIPTPYDSTILTLNNRLNRTYISYGYNGAKAYATQGMMDEKNLQMNETVAVKRATVKSKKELYKNGNWDVVDAAADDKDFINKVDIKTLPDSLRNKSRAELQQIVTKKNNERSVIQKEIGKLAVKRENYIAAEKLRNTSGKNIATLESEIEKIIRKQAARFNMVIK